MHIGHLIQKLSSDKGQSESKLKILKKMWCGLPVTYQEYYSIAGYLQTQGIANKLEYKNIIGRYGSKDDTQSQITEININNNNSNASILANSPFQDYSENDFHLLRFKLARLVEKKQYAIARGVLEKIIKHLKGSSKFDMHRVFFEEMESLIKKKADSRAGEDANIYELINTIKNYYKDNLHVADKKTIEKVAHCGQFLMKLFEAYLNYSNPDFIKTIIIEAAESAVKFESSKNYKPALQALSDAVFTLYYQISPHKCLYERDRIKWENRIIEVLDCCFEDYTDSALYIESVIELEPIKDIQADKVKKYLFDGIEYYKNFNENCYSYINNKLTNELWLYRILADNFYKDDSDKIPIEDLANFLLKNLKYFYDKATQELAPEKILVLFYCLFEPLVRSKEISLIKESYFILAECDPLLCLKLYAHSYPLLGNFSLYSDKDHADNLLKIIKKVLATEVGEKLIVDYFNAKSSITIFDRGIAKSPIYLQLFDWCKKNNKNNLMRAIIESEEYEYYTVFSDPGNLDIVKKCYSGDIDKIKLFYTATRITHIKVKYIPEMAIADIRKFISNYDIFSGTGLDYKEIIINFQEYNKLSSAALLCKLDQSAFCEESAKMLLDAKTNQGYKEDFILFCNNNSEDLVKLKKNLIQAMVAEPDYRNKIRDTLILKIKILGFLRGRTDSDNECKHLYQSSNAVGLSLGANNAIKHDIGLLDKTKLTNSEHFIFLLNKIALAVESLDEVIRNSANPYSICNLDISSQLKELKEFISQAARLFSDDNVLAYYKCITEYSDYRVQGRYQEAAPRLQQALNIVSEAQQSFLVSSVEGRIRNNNIYSANQTIISSCLSEMWSSIKKHTADKSDSQKTKYVARCSHFRSLCQNFEEKIKNNDHVGLRKLVLDSADATKGVHFLTSKNYVSAIQIIRDKIQSTPHALLFKAVKDFIDSMNKDKEFQVFIKQGQVVNVILTNNNNNNNNNADTAVNYFSEL